MNPRVSEMRTMEGSRLKLIFSNGEHRIFDASPYLAYPAYRKLTNAGFFAMARPDHGTVVWPDNIDFCPDTLYVESVREEQESYGAPNR